MSGFEAIVNQINEQADAYQQLYEQLQDTRKQLQTGRKLLDQLFQNEDLEDYSQQYLALKKTLALKTLVVSAPKKTNAAKNAARADKTAPTTAPKVKKTKEPEELNIIPTDPMAWLYTAPEQRKGYGKVEKPGDLKAAAGTNSNYNSNSNSNSNSGTKTKSSSSNSAPSPSIIKLLVDKEMYYLNPRSGLIYQRSPDHPLQAVKIGQVDSENGLIQIGERSYQLKTQPTTPVKMGYQTYHQDSTQRIYEAVGLPRLIGHIGHLDSEGQLKISA